ncbi:MAG: hypothetical protein WEC59_03240 [Salibacteraceae bacterium]
MNISFQYSGAWLMLIALVATLLVWWLYFYRNRNEDWPLKLTLLLASLRWMVIVLVGFLLLQPFIIQLVDDEEQPKLLLYEDRSASVNAEDRESVNRFSAAVEEQLSGKYEIVRLPFATHIEMGNSAAAFDSLNTDLGVVMESINEDFYGENIGAIVVVSDGIINQGKDPRYLGLNTSAGLYSLMLGDTSMRADIELSQVLSNKLAFLNNDFEIKAMLNARKFKGEQVSLKLKRNNAVIDEQEISIDNNDFTREYRFLVTADRIGVNRYTVELDLLEEESNLLNNSADVYIEVLDNRTKVQMLAHAPHPDIAAMKMAIEKSDQYEVDVAMLADWDQNIEAADLFILHGLPANANDQNKIKPIIEAEKQILFVFSSSLSLLHFNNLGLGLKIDAPRMKMDESGAFVNEQFNLFNLERNEDLRRFPPLLTPFGDYAIDVSQQTALFQRIGNIKTEKALLLFTEKSGLKHGVLLAEGWWRWRMYESSLSGSPVWTDRLIQKTVQYLAIKQKRTRLDVAVPQRIKEGEPVKFTAEYYNQSYELNNNEALNLTVTDSANSQYEYQFKPAGNGYQITTGSLPPGEYQWEAFMVVNGERFSKNGSFTVVKNRVEFIDLVADHAFLTDLSARKGGAAYRIENAGDLLQQLNELDTARTVIHTSKEWTSIIDWKVLMFIIALLMSVEWFIRKYQGYV